MSDLSTPRDALVHEVARAIEADSVLCDVEVYRGFPENLDFALPAISITASSSSSEKRKSDVYRETELPNGNLETIFETSREQISGSIELWTKDKTSREPLELALDELLEGGAVPDLSYLEPPSPGLVLELSRLYEAKVRVLLEGKTEQDASGGSDGYFRIMYSFVATVPKLRRVEYKKANFTNGNVVTTDQTEYGEA